MTIDYGKIKSLVYTEKSNSQLVNGKYHFIVSPTCSRSEVASLIKKTFGVEVEKVNIIKTPIKTKRFKGVEGITQSTKKAIVTLKKGQSINFG